MAVFYIMFLPSKTLVPLISRMQNPLTYFIFSISEARILTVVTEFEYVTHRMVFYHQKTLRMS